MQIPATTKQSTSPNADNNVGLWVCRNSENGEKELPIKCETRALLLSLRGGRVVKVSAAVAIVPVGADGGAESANVCLWGRG
jgi:hypothetical protein